MVCERVDVVVVCDRRCDTIVADVVIDEREWWWRQFWVVVHWFGRREYVRVGWRNRCDVVVENAVWECSTGLGGIGVNRCGIDRELWHKAVQAVAVDGIDSVDVVINSNSERDQ